MKVLHENFNGFGLSKEIDNFRHFFNVFDYFRKLGSKDYNIKLGRWSSGLKLKSEMTNWMAWGPQAYSYLDVTAILKLWSHMIISEAGRADYQKLTKQATALTEKRARTRVKLQQWPSELWSLLLLFVLVLIVLGLEPIKQLLLI